MKFIPALITLFFCLQTKAQNNNAPVIVNPDKVTADIQPDMWGIFFEDINFAADGGLYAELVKNRSFEFDKPLMGWKEEKKPGASGSILVLNRSQENENNPRYIRVTVNNGQHNYGLSNEGFRGMGIKQGEQYNFSVMAKQPEGSNVRLYIELVSASGEIIGKESVSPTGDTWKKYAVSFNATATEAKAKLNIWFEGAGSLDVDMISLFPQHTWKERPNGLRADLVQLLADMKPGFIRFPGGCIVEGRDLANRYQWKKTIGNVEDRKLIINRWNTEFNHRLTPDYYQSYGLGFFEYFLLAEDIGASPLPILNCGMACQYNTAEVVPLDQEDNYIQDALDLIEFANGSIDTKWGKLRAALGHPAPFNLKMMGVGNEQWGPQYVERYKIFSAAIKAKYPSIKLVNSVGPDPDGDRFNFLNDTLRKMHADFLDEHYYRSPEWFQQQAKRYDNYDRNGPQIFAGEYAAQSAGTASAKSKNNWKCALAEAAFMTGLERNADVVNMASYAPLFAHVDAWQWTPDLIWFDNLRSYGTPDYYVQKLYATNKGTNVVPVLLNGNTITGQDSLFASACIDKLTGEVIIKLVNTSNKTNTKEVLINTNKKLATKGSLTILQSDDLDKVNGLDDAMAVGPKQEDISISNKKITARLLPYSFSIIRVKMHGK
ncbi:alpha-L-arabinofuranosidase C-terminal domain-containing protein [Chitinophagaceae bacterium LWZ2-11]